MDSGWQCVYFSNQLQRIEIVRSLLDEHNIKNVVIDKRDSSYIMVGDIEIFVPLEDAILAKIIIEQSEL
jgi:hypothetical protein